jgi:hypothetical protein
MGRVPYPVSLPIAIADATAPSYRFEPSAG